MFVGCNKIGISLEFLIILYKDNLKSLFKKYNLKYYSLKY